MLYFTYATFHYILRRTVIAFLSITALALIMGASPILDGDDSVTVQDLVWLEQELIAERDALLDQANDRQNILLQTPEGSILVFERAQLSSLIERLAFLATTDLFGEELIRRLPQETQLTIETLKAFGLWGEDFVIGKAMAQMERVSEQARIVARDRARSEYDPLIERVRNYADGLRQPADFAGNWTCPVRGTMELDQYKTAVSGNFSGEGLDHWAAIGRDGGSVTGEVIGDTAELILDAGDGTETRTSVVISANNQEFSGQFLWYRGDTLLANGDWRCHR